MLDPPRVKVRLCGGKRLPLHNDFRMCSLISSIPIWDGESMESARRSLRFLFDAINPSRVKIVQEITVIARDDENIDRLLRDVRIVKPVFSHDDARRRDRP